MSGLIIFIKNPVLGHCKTRLAATIGDHNALVVYKNLLSHTRSISIKVDINRYLFYDQHVDLNDGWSNEEFKKLVQANGDLGQKMNNAFKETLQLEKKAIIIGSDCPEINENIITQAISALDHHDFVIGPTWDGGYYLLGMKDHSPSLFDDMTWSTNSVFEETINRMKIEGKSYFTLPQLSDLDNEDDLNKFPHFKA